MGEREKNAARIIPNTVMIMVKEKHVCPVFDETHFKVLIMTMTNKCIIMLAVS